MIYYCRYLDPFWNCGWILWPEVTYLLWELPTTLFWPLTLCNSVKQVSLQERRNCCYVLTNRHNRVCKSCKRLPPCCIFNTIKWDKWAAGQHQWLCTRFLTSLFACHWWNEEREENYLFVSPNKLWMFLVVGVVIHKMLVRLFKALLTWVCRQWSHFGVKTGVWTRLYHKNLINVLFIWLFCACGGKNHRKAIKEARNFRRGVSGPVATDVCR